MSTSLEVLFTPADFGALSQRDLSATVCVVFDVLRATSSMVTALGNGAEAILPVPGIPEALGIRKHRPEVLLAGERDGVRIPASLTGSIPFDLGNSPREFTAEKVRGKTIVMTTTNGTCALRACSNAGAIVIGSFLNLHATVDWLEHERPADLLIVCSGTFEQAAYEDVLGAGALCERLWSDFSRGAIADSAHMARRLYQCDGDHLADALGQSRNGRRLLSRPDLQADVAFCAQRDSLRLVASMDRDGLVKRQG